MKNKKIYGFFGTPSYDLIIYLASILNNLGAHVLVIDYSQKQDVMSCYVEPDDRIEFFQYKDVDYASNLKLSSIESLEYQYIFVYQDEPVRERIPYDGLFVISDLGKSSLKRAGDFIREYDGKVQFIIRDFCSDKLNKQYILREYLEVDINILDYNIIELDYYDYSYRIAMTHEYYQGFRHISKKYKWCLLRMVEWMASPSGKSLYRAYRWAERGKCIGSSVLE